MCAVVVVFSGGVLDGSCPKDGCGSENLVLVLRVFKVKWSLMLNKNRQIFTFFHDSELKIESNSHPCWWRTTCGFWHHLRFQFGWCRMSSIGAWTRTVLHWCRPRSACGGFQCGCGVGLVGWRERSVFLKCYCG